MTKSPTRWPIDNFILMVPEHICIWKDVSYADARSTFQNKPPLVGTGPMIVAEFQQGQFVRLRPNQYFRTGKPPTSGMILNLFSMADPIAQGLESGSLDYGVNLTAAQWADLSKDPDIAVGESRTEQRNFLALNTASGDGAGSTKALQDPAFRDAIGYAIDQKTIVDRAFRGHAETWRWAGHAGGDRLLFRAELHQAPLRSRRGRPPAGCRRVPGYERRRRP